MNRAMNLAVNPDWAKLPLFDRSKWTRVRFGDVVENLNETCDPAEAGIERYIGLEHLEPGSQQIRTWGNVADGTTFTRRVRPKQVLFGKRRAYQRKVAVADFDAVVSGDIYVLMPKGQQLVPELLPFLCLSERFFQHAVGTSAGSLSPRTNWNSLANFEFELPPADQQKTISNALTLLELVKREKESVVVALNEINHALVSNFFFAKATDSHRRLFQPRWKIAQLHQIVDTDAPIRYGIVQVGRYCEDGIPTVAIKNLGGDFGSDLHLTDPKIEQQYAGSRIRGGDLLLSIKASVGEVGIVPNGFQGNISRDIARIRCGTALDARLLFYLFRSDRYAAYVSKYVVGSTRKEISIHHLRKFEVPIVSRKDSADFLDAMSDTETTRALAQSDARNLTAIQTKLNNFLLDS